MSQHLSCVSEVERDIFLGLGASVLCLLSFILVLITFTNDRAGKMTIFLALGTVMPITFVLSSLLRIGCCLQMRSSRILSLICAWQPASGFLITFGALDISRCTTMFLFLGARGRTPVCLRALWLLSSNVLVYLAAFVQGFLRWADSLFMSIFAERFWDAVCHLLHLRNHVFDFRVLL